MNELIQSLWIGRKLSAMERLSIASFLANGHEYHLYVYDKIENSPQGTVLKAADGEQLVLAQRWLEKSERDISSFAVVPLDMAAADEFDRLRQIRNLRKIGRGDLLHLVLFDFSLTRTPPDNVEADTTGSHDPNRQIDAHAVGDSLADTRSLPHPATGALFSAAGC